MSSREQLAKRITAVSVGVVVAGVIAVGIPANAAYTLPNPPEQDRAEWLMPLDAYIGPSTTRLTYAEELLIEPCLQAAGFEGVEVPWRDVDAATNALESQPVRAFDLTDARARGYHVAPTDDPGATAWRTYSTTVFADPVFDARMRCGDQVLTEHPELAQDDLTSSIAIRLGDAAFSEARRDDRVLDTADEWRSCLIDADVFETGPFATEALAETLPRSPAGMPTIDMAAEFGSDDPSSPISSDEIRLATADAACRESSGYLEALYQAEWQRQLTVPHDYGEVLAQVDVEGIAAATRTVERVLETRTPARR